ncbi:hypothetical protein KSP40_PGU021769 [Platanthera guangdongensis]|uniref:Uncharacterized protein n=1 Tax=Platanthera guangdongensis TaxID=2320717 RepID=A0ABR2LJI4_9ASPA
MTPHHRSSKLSLWKMSVRQTEATFRCRQRRSSVDSCGRRRSGVDAGRGDREAIEDLRERLPHLKELVDRYSGPDRVTAKQQQEELERVAKTLPENIPASVKRFTDRAVISLQWPYRGWNVVFAARSSNNNGRAGRGEKSGLSGWVWLWVEACLVGVWGEGKIWLWLHGRVREGPGGGKEFAAGFSEEVRELGCCKVI